MHNRVLSAPTAPSDLDLSRRDNCVDPDPANTVTDRINTLLNSSGPGYVLTLCPNREYVLQSPILFAAPDQEISTLGYPTDGSRATLTVNGPVANGVGHTTAVDGTCSDCSGITLRHVQINGGRRIAPPTSGGANIEFGGDNANQTIEFVRSFDPRSWSCLHIAEGPFTCTNILIQNNDIGPCGVDAFQEWADGISVSCQSSIVRNNMVKGPTDGGIVLFGSPGTQVYNNTIWITNQTLLGGINMVDYLPWNGNFSNTVVRNNTIIGGYATGVGDKQKGTNADDAIIKIGIAMGPRTWFGDRYLSNVSSGGTVENNIFSGAFSYAMAMSSASDFIVQNNILVGNTSFIGASGPNCSTSDIVPTPAPFVYDNSTTGVTLQTDFQLIPDADSLTCVVPPDGGDYWPYGGDPGASSASTSAEQSSSSMSATSSTVGVAVGVIIGIGVLGVFTWFLRKWFLKRIEQKHLYEQSKELVPGKGLGYIKHA
ncbi:pectin lyase fold/virulence factor [Mycena pura]|uniref:Pectin lyase fold/virulence factor n=1 Tax=Mycena pura TaxID=153505 RepID=A0AAD6Y003_9AGAR|nr:pectin lyase fold/virulence factor [Mycena pura]